MNRVNELILVKSDFKDFDQVLSTAIKLLLDAGYITIVSLEDAGVYCIKYALKDSNVYPYWLTEEQACTIEYIGD